MPFVSNQQSIAKLACSVIDGCSTQKQILKAIGDFHEELGLIHDSTDENKNLFITVFQQIWLTMKESNVDLLTENFIFDAITINEKIFDLTYQELFKDKPFVIEVLKVSGLALEMISQELKKDLDVVLVAVQQNGLALRYADPTLKQNKQVVLTAVTKNVSAMVHAGEDLSQNRAFLNAAAIQNEKALDYIKDKKLRENIMKDMLFPKVLDGLKTLQSIEDEEVRNLVISELKSFQQMKEAACLIKQAQRTRGTLFQIFENIPAQEIIANVANHRSHESREREDYVACRALEFANAFK